MRTGLLRRLCARVHQFGKETRPGADPPLAGSGPVPLLPSGTPRGSLENAGFVLSSAYSLTLENVFLRRGWVQLFNQVVGLLEPVVLQVVDDLHARVINGQRGSAMN